MTVHHHQSLVGNPTGFAPPATVAETYAASTRNDDSSAHWSCSSLVVFVLMTATLQSIAANSWPGIRIWL